MNDLFLWLKTKKACKDENHPYKPYKFNEIRVNSDEIFGVPPQMKSNPPNITLRSKISSQSDFIHVSEFIPT